MENETIDPKFYLNPRVKELATEIHREHLGFMTIYEAYMIALETERNGLLSFQLELSQAYQTIVQLSAKEASKTAIN